MLLQYIPVIFLVAFCLQCTIADYWGYSPEEVNGVIKEDEQWNGQCRIGRKQSPIDLARDASVIGKFKPLYFKNYDNVISNATVRNTGHSLQIDIPIEQEYLMTGGGLPGIYRMDQMHFHWASEHKIDNKRFGLELHIVSHDQRFKNFSTAVQNRKGIAVLGVLFHVSDDVNLVLKNILDTAERVREIVGETSFMTMPIAPAQLLPPDRLSYFRYEGSLTTPSCDEAVIWTIFDRSIPFAMTQIERFQQVKDPDGNLLTHNFRQLQRLNSRPLVYVRDDNAFYIHSAATIQTISLAMIISIILIQRVQVFGA